MVVPFPTKRGLGDGDEGSHMSRDMVSSFLLGREQSRVKSHSLLKLESMSMQRFNSKETMLSWEVVFAVFALVLAEIAKPMSSTFEMGAFVMVVALFTFSIVSFFFFGYIEPHDGIARLRKLDGESSRSSQE